MSEVFALEISSNVSDFPYEKKYPAMMTLGELKKKLELVVGTVSDQISIELRDSEGKFLASLTDNKRSLKDLGVKDGMRIHAVDVSGQNVELSTDGDMVEKYEISEEAYSKREDSVRAFREKMKAQMGGQSPVSVSKESPRDAQEEAAEKIKVGDRCEVTVAGQMPRRGVVAFVGTTQFKKGHWIGVKYDEPVGKNDGSVAGVRYFVCDNKYGGFVRPTDVNVGDYPEISIEEDMDEL